MASSGAGAQPFASSITVDGGVTTTVADKVAVTVAAAAVAPSAAAAPAAAAPEVGSKRNPITPAMLELVAKVDNEKGLTAEAVATLTSKWGANVLPSKSRSKVLIFLSFLYGVRALRIAPPASPRARPRRAPTLPRARSPHLPPPPPPATRLPLRAARSRCPSPLRSRR